MASNPERMRPTELSKAPILIYANEVVLKEALRVNEEAKGKKDEALQRVTRQFVLNDIVDKHYEPKKQTGGGQQ